MTTEELPVHLDLLRTPEGAAPFRAMTYPAYAPLLEDPALREVVAVGACDPVTGTPVGLGLGQRNGKVGQVLSVFVAPDARRKRIGTKLLALVVNTFEQRGIGEAFLNYPAERPSTPAVERMLARLDWGKPVVRMRLFHGTRRSFDSAPKALWFRRDLPPEYAFFPWQDLRPEERSEVVRWLRTGIAPAYVGPFENDARVDPVMSLGLRYRGGLVGWLVCHTLAEQTVRFTSLFMHPDVLHKGLALRLASEAIHRHLHRPDYPEERETTFACVEGTPLIAFAERRFLPCIPELRMTRTFESRKTLPVVGK